MPIEESSGEVGSHRASGIRSARLPFNSSRIADAGPLVRAVVQAGLAIVILIAVARLAMWAWTQPVSFDGATTLEVARSLADGHGYHRLYGDHGGFSHEMQTRAPYILPAAGIFWIFGSGVWQAQLANLAYLLALALLAFLLLRRWASWRWGVAAVAICLCTPGIEEIGLNGYGEVPAAVWWLLSLLILYHPGDTQPVRWARALAAGFVIGVAIVTKTVLLIGLAASVLIFATEQLRRGCHPRPLLVGIAAFVIGACVPILLHEAAHLLFLGGTAPWMAWLHEEWQSIKMQAGTAAGFNDSPTAAARVVKHFGLLLASIGVSAWLLLLWFGGSALLLFGATRRRISAAASPVLLTLALVTLIYFVWWLGITPTQKAWYRRIFDGMISLELLIVLATATIWKQRSLLPPATRAAWAGTACLVLALQGFLAWTGLASEKWPSTEPGRLLAQDMAMIRELPASASLYGIGWFSNPVIALYSGRAIGDITDATSSDLAAHASTFLLLDLDTRRAGVDRYWLKRYANEKVAESDDLHIHRLATDVVNDPFEGVPVDPAALRNYANFEQADYPYTFGLQDREGSGWRWASADVDLMLRYEGEDTFVIDAYMVEPETYRSGRHIGITVWVGNCRVGAVQESRAGAVKLSLPLATCALHSGDVQHVRLASDNMVDSTDDRQLCFIARGLGFANAAAADPG